MLERKSPSMPLQRVSGKELSEISKMAFLFPMGGFIFIHSHVQKWKLLLGLGDELTSTGGI